eukprot:CAMPEP_0198207446 /NCGR_PEP_ID=MMETSP1445-20131203/10893_1 /TAXON_ID=36898 /ORGANISM="Pyramimonas sp., Strain CCMP2087" /LENGTH=149 /DNA_ID=CAMNT_0043880475 /DNA_START=202 /DNA_END=651 /DNA_ORIENTATION=+
MALRSSVAISSPCKRSLATTGRGKITNHQPMRVASTKRRMMLTVRASVEPTQKKENQEAPVESPLIPPTEDGVPPRAETPTDFVVDKELLPNKESLLDGVRTEMGLIEWPNLGSVGKSTVFVLGLVAASAFALLALNSVLNELSKSLFG